MPGSSMLEPMVVPRLPIDLADFPYAGVLRQWARARQACCGSVRARARFSPAVRAGSARDAPQHTRGKLAPRAHRVPSPSPQGPPTFVVSHALLRQDEPAWLPSVIATASKICADGPSTRARARASPQPSRLPTAQVSGPAAPSIFARRRFDRYVATRFLAGADLHGHRPTVRTCARASVRGCGPLTSLGLLCPSQAVLTAACPLGAQQRWISLLRTLGVIRKRTLDRTLLRAPAVLRDISAGTSYQTVRLVFRP